MFSRQLTRGETRGEELLFYPQMTLMTQIFFWGGGVVGGNQQRCGEGQG